MKPRNIEQPGPGQESVWDYPRPPALETVDRRLAIEHASEVIAETTRGFRVLETSHPPVYYFPPDDVSEWVVPDQGSSFCEWKGSAAYHAVEVDGERLSRVAWSYPDPTPRFESIAGYIAFYCAPFDACWVGDERAKPQPGGFYGGWITSDVVGPFKGEPGTMFW
jgi:uncharacterized protein (DUF427 family)